MFIQNAVLKSINAEGLSFPLAEGSVVSVGGVTGIVPTTLNVRPATNRIYVAVAGTIDLTSDANKGVTFTDEQIQELGADFNFVPAVESGGGGGGGGGGTEYDLVLRCEGEGLMAIPSISPSNYSIVSGSVHDFVAKFESGGTPNAILYGYEYDDEYMLEGNYSINRLVYFDIQPYPSEGEGEVHLFFPYCDYNNNSAVKVIELTMFEKTNTIYSAIRH